MFQNVQLLIKSFSNSFVDDREENEDEIDSLLEDIDASYQEERKTEVRGTLFNNEVFFENLFCSMKYLTENN